MRVREVLDKLPFALKLLIPLVVLAYYASILLIVLFSPLAYIYGRLLCLQAWIDWEKQGKDVLVIQAESAHSREWMGRLTPLISHRSVILNYDERDRWDRRSLPVQLFDILGPQAMPERFTGDNLPAVIVFRKMKAPKEFIFGKRSKDCDEKLEQLRAELALTEAQLLRSVQEETTKGLHSTSLAGPIFGA